MTLSSLHAQAVGAGSPDYFELKIRPVLANQCYSCHTDTHLGDLRLDSREGMLKGGKRGAALVPGDAEKSLLVRAVQQTDANLKMPMGGKLKDSEIQDIVAWVKAGGVWPKAVSPPAPATSGAEAGKYTIAPERRNFWSLLPLKEITPPGVPAGLKDPRWNRTAIDRFIFANLQKEGLKPVKAASRRDLLRRATFDLIGLPPTPEEIAAFDKDTSPDAFAKVVDRLLASPHYGERWGRIWLDVARYGEDDYRSLNPNPRGYHPYPNAFVYRDWVIQAMNDDLSYGRFVTAQIAGDLMDEKTRYKTLPATGFLGLGPWYYDNGAVEVTHADERHDRVDVVTRGFLGLTVACARCHDHKYDPIPTTDYYSLAGVFLNTAYHEYPRVPKTVLDQYTNGKEELEQKQKVLQTMQTNLSSQLSESLAFKTSNYLQAVYEVAGQKKDIDPVVEARKLDYELLQRWIKYMEKPTDKYKFKEAWQALMKKAVPVAAGAGGGGMGGPPPESGGSGGSAGGGRGGRGVNPVAKKAADAFQEQVIRVMLARKELQEENDIIAAKALEGTKKKKRANEPNEFITNDDFCPNCGLRLKNMLEADNNLWTEIFQRELLDSDDPVAMMAMGGRGGKPGVLLFRGWGLESRIGAEPQTQIAAIRADIEEARKKLEPAYPFMHGVQDAAKPVNLPVSIRGNPENLGPEVPRHFLSMLSKDEPQPFSKGSGRLELAEEILKQPIAMRVIVNRIWKGHFGSGIVDTPSNFGIMGERPSNPELLEYLAGSFVANGMSMKKLHREIMLSSVYQLSSETNEANLAKDSGNRLYWRFDRKRLEAEQLRDAVLLISGNLDRSQGGPSVDLSPAFTRRTVYGKVSRYKLDEYLQLFDFPAPNISAEKRFATTVPQQRLFLMNSDFMQAESEELAKRVATEPDNRSRIKKVYLLIYGRDPSEEEIKLGLDYLHAEPMREYEENKNKPPEGGGRGGRGGPPTTTSEAIKPETPQSAVGDKGASLAPESTVAGAAAPQATVAADAAPEAETADAPAMPMGMGMMGGMGAGPGGRRGGAPAVPTTVKYEPTAWGRYVKVLFSSSEFLFIQ